MKVHYDAERDILTVEGVKYSGAFFRELALRPEPGRLFRIIAKEYDLVTIRRYFVNDEDFEAWYAKQERKCTST